MPRPTSGRIDQAYVGAIPRPAGRAIDSIGAVYGVQNGLAAPEVAGFSSNN
jgi:hypothetical protein